ncbi:MAG: hypothetical protein ACMXYF_00945 [Candidatus Woesearchaeota archaeon]
MSQKVKQTGIVRESGFLYFIDKDGDISRSSMARGATRVKGSQKVKQVGLKKESGFLYYIDKQGDICRVEMTRGRKK